MTTSMHRARVATALLAATAATLLVTSAALAHPESEGDHPSGCVVTAEPGSVAVGGQFTVAGNFGGASIFIVPGAGADPAQGATPNATTPAGDSFSVTFVAEAGDVGELTVHGILPETECGDADSVTVTAATPNTALPVPPVPVMVIGAALLVVGLALGTDRLIAGRGRN